MEAYGDKNKLLDSLTDEMQRNWHSSITDPGKG